MSKMIALGTFDGLHVAHHAVLRGADAVLLFREHPQKHLKGQAPPKLLSNEARATKLSNAGIGLLYIDFEEIAALAPEQFFSEILRRRFGATGLRCGHNYRFGAHAAGDVNLLKKLCAKHRMKLYVVPKVVFQGEAVSSSRIRESLQNGKIEQANAMLCRAFGYDFEVMRGAQIGRTIGTPTLNQHFPAGFVVPRDGVYVSRTYVNKQWRPSITNIGVRPSLDGKELRSETHIPGFDGDLYGQHVPVRLLKYIREERKFDNLEGLKKQIAKDLAAL